jgi:spore cortex biosynthesis protein YabQ
MLSTLGQSAFLLGTFLLGCAGGLCFDIYRFMRRRYRYRKWMGAFGDMLFWGVMLVLVYGYLLITVHGEFRLSTICALFLGTWVYIKKISPWQKKIWVKKPKK